MYNPYIWTLIICEEELLREWDKKILRMIFGAVCEKKEWRIRINIFLNTTRHEKQSLRQKKGETQWLNHMQ